MDKGTLAIDLDHVLPLFSNFMFYEQGKTFQIPTDKGDQVNIVLHKDPKTKDYLITIQVNDTESVTLSAKALIDIIFRNTKYDGKKYEIYVDYC